jgi:nucleotide-binding universal stress UspA family protein
MFRTVMVAVDGSTFSEQALGWAYLIGRAASAELHLVMVHEGRPPGERGFLFISEHVDAQQREAEEEYLAALVEQASRDSGLRVQSSLLTGVPATALTDAAARRGTDLLVLSTHGRGGINRLWLGSVADQVVRRARVPVLLVRPVDEGGPATEEPRMRRVLAAVDGSAPSEAVLHQSAALCALTGAECTIIRVVVPPTHIITSRIPDTAALVRQRTEEAAAEAEEYLREIGGRGHWQPTATRTEVVIGNDAAAAILRCAADEAADVIAVGTSGHGGAARMILGSVADKVIRGSHTAVLVIPERALD